LKFPFHEVTQNRRQEKFEKLAFFSDLLESIPCTELNSTSKTKPKTYLIVCNQRFSELQIKFGTKTKRNPLFA
jgi:hypothetical protein